MKLKKLLCLTLAAIMLLSIVPLQIFAENSATTESETSVCYVELGGVKTYYDNLNDAILAAESGATVVMTKDSSITGYKTITGKNLTIDGAGYTLTGGDGYAFDIAKGSNAECAVTIKNMTLNSGWGVWTDIANLTIEDCIFNMHDGMSVSYAGSGSVNFIDSVFNFDNGNAKSEPFMRTGNGGDNVVVLNMVNTQITVNSGISTDRTVPNNAIFNVYTKQSLTVNMDETSSIVANGNYVCAIFSFNSIVSQFNLNLAEGATLKLNNAVKGAYFFANTLSFDKMNITDNGANWVVGAEAAKKGVNLPIFAVDGAPAAWNNGTETVSGKWGNPAATADTVFSLVKGDNYDYYVYIVDANGDFVKEYDNVKLAFAAQTNGQKIIVNGDTKLPGTISTATYTDVVREVVIEGVQKVEGIKAEIFSSAGIADTLSLWNLTLRNVEITNDTSADMFYFDTWYSGGWKDVHNGGNVLIEDCIINNSGERMFKCRGGASTEVKHDPFYITFNNSVVNHKGTGTMIWSNFYADVRLNIKDSTVTANGVSVVSVDEALVTGTKNSSATVIADNSVINVANTAAAFIAYEGALSLDVQLKNNSVINHSGSKAVLRSDATTAATVRIELDSSKILSTASFPIGYMGEKTMAKNLEFTLKNNSLISQVGGSGSMYYSYLFMLEPNSVDSVLEVNVDGTSELYANMTNAGTAAGIVYGCYVSTANINLEAGAKIGIESRAANVNIFNGTETGYGGAKGTINLVDKGAIYTIGETAIANAASGVKLPNLVLQNADSFIGYTDGTSIYNTNVVTVAGSYQTAAYTAADFDIIDGASIRTKDGSGIRFSTTVSDELLAMLGDNVKFGTLIGNEALLGDGVAPTLEDIADDPVTVMNIPQTKWGSDGNTFHAALIGIPDTATSYQVKLSGRAYMTVTYADGTTTTIYTDFDDNNVRSMYDVAVNLTDAGKGSDVTKFIIDTVNAAS